MILLINLLHHVKGGAIAVYSIMYVCVGVLLLKGVWFVGMSLARGGRSLEVGKFEKELEDALLSTQAGSINVSYWMNNWPSIEECLELLPLDPVPLVSTALMPTDKGIE